MPATGILILFDLLRKAVYPPFYDPDIHKIRRREAV